MADKTSLIIETTDYANNNPNQITVSNVAPNADSSKLKTWAQMTAALSKDRYVKSTRVDRKELDTDSKPVYVQSISAPIDWNGTTSYWKNIIPTEGVINVNRKVFGSSNTMTIPLQASYSYDSAVNKSCHSQFYVTDVSGTGSGLWSIGDSIHYANGQSCSWRTSIVCSVNEACDVTFTVNMDESYNFAAFERTFTLHIFDEEEGGEG